MTTNRFYHQHLLSLDKFKKSDLQLVLETAQQLKLHPKPTLLNNKIIAHCFFESSTRTRLSFESASLRLGAQNIGFSDSRSLSTQKGESLSDTINVISSYADALVIRHPESGSAALAAHVSRCPVINAGDGANQHPTQALLDLYTIQECQHKLEQLSIGITGDLKHARTIHSLIDACSLFNMTFYFVAVKSLALPPEIIQKLDSQGIKYSIHESLDEVMSKLDILYITRIQKERIANSEQFCENFKLSSGLLKDAKDNLKILHPLPRLEELPAEIDHSPYAYYFQQAKNGVIVRQAILALLLNESLPC